MVLLQTSPCDQYECQNGAQCIVVQQEPTCRCPPGFAGARCEKLITVNFVGKDSYVELASAKVRPQANISLQVCMLFPSQLGRSEAPSEYSWGFPLASLTLFPECELCRTWARAVHKKLPGESHSRQQLLINPLTP